MILKILVLQSTVFGRFVLELVVLELLNLDSMLSLSTTFTVYDSLHSTI